MLKHLKEDREVYVVEIVGAEDDVGRRVCDSDDAEVSSSSDVRMEKPVDNGERLRTFFKTDFRAHGKWSRLWKNWLLVRVGA
jgi:hypothetical protein